MYRTALAALALACVASPVLAADAAAIVVQAAPSLGASIPYGDVVVALLQAVLPVAVAAIVSLVGLLTKKLFPLARLFLTDRVVESAVQKWADFALNEVAGAMRGKRLDFETGSAVLNALVNRAVDRANVSKQGAKLLELVGGPAEAARKGFRLLHLDEGVSGEILEQVLADLRASGHLKA